MTHLILPLLRCDPIPSIFDFITHTHGRCRNTIGNIPRCLLEVCGLSCRSIRHWSLCYKRIYIISISPPKNVAYHPRRTSSIITTAPKMQSTRAAGVSGFTREETTHGQAVHSSWVVVVSDQPHNSTAQEASSSPLPHSMLQSQ
jgi:hypothetical protein